MPEPIKCMACGAEYEVYFNPKRGHVTDVLSCQQCPNDFGPYQGTYRYLKQIWSASISEQRRS